MRAAVLVASDAFGLQVDFGDEEHVDLLLLLLGS